MKKGIFSLLIVLVLITASCSISAGIPWLYGGWGFFADFGFNPSETRDNLEKGFLSLEQDGAELSGTLELNDVVYTVKGSYLKEGTVVLTLFDGEELVYELQGAVGDNKLEGTDNRWHAEKEL